MGRAQRKDEELAKEHYENTYRLIERLYYQQRRGVQTLVLEMPFANILKLPSEWEKIIVNNEKKNFRKVFEKDPQKYLPLSGYDMKYADFFLNYRLYSPKHILYRDYRVRADIRNKYVNIINHVRPAVGIPMNVHHDIHIIGDSTAIGYVVFDEDTSASYLQGKINEKRNGNEVHYACMIHGACGIAVDIMQRFVRDLVVGQGDIVVIIGVYGLFKTQEFIKSCNENGVPFCHTQPYFERPHGLGELFFDHQHLNPNGNKLIGEIMYEKLFVNCSKLSVPEVFQHYYFHSIQSVLVDEDKKACLLWNEDERYSNSEFLLFLQNLNEYHSRSQTAGSIVMNCNPFTLGHLYLVEVAAAQMEMLYVFVVEENQSEFPFADRLELVKSGTAHLSNVLVLPSGRFIISSVTFPEYFVKGENPDVPVDASMDLEIFCEKICPVLGINTRFVGEEPFDPVTQKYNDAMKTILPKHNIKLEIIPRKKVAGAPISASRVRALLKTKNFDETALVVPETTLAHLVTRNPRK